MSGQAKDGDKLNEITAISDLLDLLEIEGSTITIEEIVNKNVIMYCQLKIVKTNKKSKYNGKQLMQLPIQKYLKPMAMDLL